MARRYCNPKMNLEHEHVRYFMTVNISALIVQCLFKRAMIRGRWSRRTSNAYMASKTMVPLICMNSHGKTNKIQNHPAP